MWFSINSFLNRLEPRWRTGASKKNPNYCTTVSKLWKTGLLLMRTGCKNAFAVGRTGHRHRNIMQFNKLLWGGGTVWCWVLRPAALARTVRGFAQRAVVHRPSLTLWVARGSFPGGLALRMRIGPLVTFSAAFADLALKARLRGATGVHHPTAFAFP